VEQLEVRVVLHANAAMDAEHLAVFGSRDATTHQISGGLVPDAAVTDTLIHSGNWSTPGNWSSGVPKDGDNVLIPFGLSVTVDGDETVSAVDNRVVLRTIRVDRTMSFAQHANTKLLVDTIIVEKYGVFEMGTATDPIDATHRARVIFADQELGMTTAQQTTFEATRLQWDPLQFSLGLLSHGEVSIYGTHVTSFVSGQANNSANSTKLDLGLPVPTDWKVGDRLIVSGNTGTNAANVNQDDQVQIASISGNVITLSASTPLMNQHFRNSTYIADVNRNATFESETPGIIARRGHVMFMHNDDVHVDAAGFYGLGRTDKRTAIDDPIVKDDPDHPGLNTTDVLLTDINPSDPSLGHRVLVPVVDATGATVIDPATGLPKMQIAKTGLNPRGRYAVHFHRTGTDSGDTPATINDSVVIDSPGWGIVNHSSYVNVTDNVVFNAVGASYVTEAGDEIGSFDHNLAMHSQGSGQHIKARETIQDFGHQGDGFWLQGGNVSVTNNVVTGMRHSGYVFFPRGLNQKEIGVTQISGANLTNYSWADPTKFYDVGDVPLKQFKGNIDIGGEDGYESWFTLLNATHDSRNVIENFKVSNTTVAGIAIPYTRDTTFKNVTVTGNPARPLGVGIDRNGVTESIDYDHVNVQFWEIGIAVPQRGNNNITGGKFNDLKNIYIVSADKPDRVVNINDASPTDPIQFLDNLKLNVNGVVTAAKQYDIYLAADLQPNFLDLPRVFLRDAIQIGLVTHNGQQVYFYEQAANFTPFPSTTQSNSLLFGPKAAPYVPAQLLNKTNAQLYAQ
jgi:hypothetical protein